MWPQICQPFYVKIWICTDLNENIIIDSNDQETLLVTTLSHIHMDTGLYTLGDNPIVQTELAMLTTQLTAMADELHVKDQQQQSLHCFLHLFI